MRKRTQGNTLRTAGSISGKGRGSLTNLPRRKGIGHPRPLDQGRMAPIRDGKERENAPAGNRGSRGGSPLPAARSSPAWSVKALRATVR